MCADTKPDNPIPLYQQIEAALRRRIDSGELTPNSMLPSRRELAREFGVALPTVERAIAVLLSDGTLRADDRRGTFVSESRDTLRTSKPREAAQTVVGAITSLRGSGPDAELQSEWTTSILTSFEQALDIPNARVICVDRSRFSGNGLSIEAAISRLRAEGVQALALVNEHHAVDQSVTALEESGLPFVIVTCEKIRRPVRCVFVDKYGSGYQAAQHLISAGYSDVTFLAPLSADWVDARIDGARDAMQQSDLSASAFDRYPSEPVAHLDSAQADCSSQLYTASGYDCALRLLKTRRPSAIIAANDQTAYGVYQAAQELGLSVGTDFGLVGFDDHREARFYDLTTLRTPLDEMGREAGRLLLAALQGAGCCCCPTQVRLCPHLIVRGSTTRV